MKPWVGGKNMVLKGEFMQACKSLFCSFFFVLILSSCGGGGSTTPPPVVSTLSFPLGSGLRASAEFSNIANYTVSGYCSGTAFSSSADSYLASFQGASAVAGITTEYFSFTDCTPSTSTSVVTSYFDNNFVPLGSIASTGEFGEYSPLPSIPASVKVGDAGTIGTMYNYLNASKSVPIGRDVFSYVIKPDTAATAIVEIVDLSYDAGGVQIATTSNRYRIFATGDLIPVSSEIKAGSKDFLLTAVPDTSPPYVVSHIPQSSSPISPSNTPITAKLSEAIDPTSIKSDQITLVSEVGGAIAGTVSFSGRTLTFAPSAPLSYNGLYTVTVASGLKDLLGNTMSSNSSWTFAIDIIPPSVSSVLPANLATGISLNTTVTATFSEPPKPATITNNEFKLMNGAAPVLGTVSDYGQYVTFTPSSPLLPNTTYTATITTGVQDYSGNALASDYSWSFTTDNLLFQGETFFFAGAQGEAVAIGDVNGDGKNDIVMTSRGSLSPSLAYALHVSLQNSSGGLNTRAVYTTHSSATCIGTTVAIGDVNHDGQNDVVIGNSGCGLEVFLTDAFGGLPAGIVYASNDTGKIRIADMNHDGLMDVVGVGSGTGTVSVWLQNVGGTLNAPVVYNLNHGGGEDIDVGDVNNDGLTDIVVMSGQSNFQIGVLTQTVAGSFNAPAYYDVGTIAPNGVAVGDINGDGKNDVVVTYGGNPPNSGLGVFYQNATSTLNSMVGFGSNSSNPVSVEIADVTGDGRKDVVVHHYGGTIGVYEQLSDGSLKAEKEYYSEPYGQPNPQNMAVGDINGDGKPDAVFSGFELVYHY